MKLDVSSLAHTKWECKYHIVFAQKYRRQVIYGKVKEDIEIRHVMIPEGTKNIKDNVYEAAKVWRDEVIIAMNNLRKVADTFETKVDSKDWPMPTYIDLLYGV